MQRSAGSNGLQPRFHGALAKVHIALARRALKRSTCSLERRQIKGNSRCYEGTSWRGTKKTSFPSTRYSYSSAGNRGPSRGLSIPTQYAADVLEERTPLRRYLMMTEVQEITADVPEDANDQASHPDGRILAEIRPFHQLIYDEGRQDQS